MIANIDRIRAELPDVFSIGSGSTNYPINFAGAPFLSGFQTVSSAYPEPAFTLPCDIYPNNPNIPFYSQTNQPTGFYGASVAARAALYKNINPYGKNPLVATAYDMLDNDGNGLVDDATEGNWSNTAVDGNGNSTGVSILQSLLNLHRHQTARAEVLYAILVEGQGPLGSAFNADDFTDKEVQDTDGDGLPEFVDAWGQPLQFYRWPLMYNSDLQKGYELPPGTASAAIPPPPQGPYASVFEPREQNALDPNQLLMAPRWWAAQYNIGPPNTGPAVPIFQGLFHSLYEPNANPQGAGAGSISPAFNWDRGTTNGLGATRRAFYSKFLIASSGLDQELGIARLDATYQTAAGSAITPLTPPYSAQSLMLESQARQTDLNPDFTYFARHRRSRRHRSRTRRATHSCRRVTTTSRTTTTSPLAESWNHEKPRTAPPSSPRA